MSRACSRTALVLILTVLASALPAAAQDVHEGAGVGIKGGFLYNTLNFKSDEDLFDGKAGWMAGLFFGGNRPGPVGVMGEINVLKKSALCGCNDQQNDLYYLQVPVLLRINAGSRSLSGVSVYGIAGPAIDLKIGEKLNANLIDEYEGFDVSLVGGVGVEITRLIIEARGTWGFRTIAKDFSDEKVTSRTFAILAGFRFN